MKKCLEMFGNNEMNNFNRQDLFVIVFLMIKWQLREADKKNYLLEDILEFNSKATPKGKADKKKKQYF